MSSSSLVLRSAVVVVLGALHLLTTPVADARVSAGQCAACSDSLICPDQAEMDDECEAQCDAFWSCGACTSAGSECTGHNTQWYCC